MEGLIIWLIILGIAIYNSKKKKNAKSAGGRPQNNQHPQNNQKVKNYQKPQNYQKVQGYQKPQGYQKSQGYQKPQGYQNMAQMQAEVDRKKQSDIMSRAFANVKENEVDELEKNQSTAPINEITENVHNMMGITDIANSSDLMAQINDLMIMGYQANLSFERDFVAEGVDMLNSYEMPVI